MLVDEDLQWERTASWSHHQIPSKLEARQLAMLSIVLEWACQVVST